MTFWPCFKLSNTSLHYLPLSFSSAVVYTIEFQKRGLPHVHLILWLKKDKPLDAAQIDAFISAQLPDPSIDPTGFEVVSKFMIHGPCEPLRTSSPCMIDGKCDKFYPKKIVSTLSSYPMVMLPTPAQPMVITHLWCHIMWTYWSSIKHI